MLISFSACWLVLSSSIAFGASIGSKWDWTWMDRFSSSLSTICFSRKSSSDNGWRLGSFFYLFITLQLGQVCGFEFSLLIMNWTISFLFGFTYGDRFLLRSTLLFGHTCGYGLLMRSTLLFSHTCGHGLLLRSSLPILISIFSKWLRLSDIYRHWLLILLLSF